MNLSLFIISPCISGLLAQNDDNRGASWTPNRGTRENASLKKKLGIRKFLVPIRPQPTPMDDQISEENGNPVGNASVKTEKKPPLFFVTGIKSISSI